MGQLVKKNQYINNAYWLSGYVASMAGPDKKELLRKLRDIGNQLLEAADNIDENGFFKEED